MWYLYKDPLSKALCILYAWPCVSVDVPGVAGLFQADHGANIHNDRTSFSAQRMHSRF